MYILHLVILCCIYASLTLTLAGLLLRAGIVSFAHIVFFGTAAYVAAILGGRCGTGFLANLGCAVVANLFLGLVFARILRYLTREYLLVGTVAIVVIIHAIESNLTCLTNGSRGISSIPPVLVAGMLPLPTYGWAGIAVAMLLGTLWCVRQLGAGPYGRLLDLVSEDEYLAVALGKDACRVKTQVLVIAAVLSSVPGTLYAHYMSFVDPTTFTPSESVLLLAAGILSARRSLAIAVIVGSILVVLPELIRFVPFDGVSGGPIRQIMFGGLLAWCVCARPRAAAPELIGAAATRLT